MEHALHLHPNVEKPRCSSMIHHISATPAMKYSWPFIMMCFIIPVKLSSDQCLCLPSLQPGSLLLSLPQCQQGLDSSPSPSALRLVLLCAGGSGHPGCCGIRRETRTLSACSKLKERNKIQTKIDTLSPV